MDRCQSEASGDKDRRLGLIIDVSHDSNYSTPANRAPLCKVCDRRIARICRHCLASISCVDDGFRASFDQRNSDEHGQIRQCNGQSYADPPRFRKHSNGDDWEIFNAMIADRQGMRRTPQGRNSGEQRLRAGIQVYRRFAPRHAGITGGPRSRVRSVTSAAFGY